MAVLIMVYRTPIQKFIENSVTNGIGYNSETVLKREKSKRGFLARFVDPSEEEVRDSSIYSVRAHLAHLNYVSIRGWVLNTNYLLKNASEDYEFKFLNGRTGQFNERKRMKRKNIRLMKRLKNEISYNRNMANNEAELKEIRDGKWMMKSLEGFIRGVGLVERDLRKIEKRLG